MYITAHYNTSALVKWVVNVILWLDYAVWTLLGPVLRLVSRIVLWVSMELLAGRRYSDGDASLMASRIWYCTGLLAIVIALRL